MISKYEIKRLKAMEDEADGIWAVPPVPSEPVYKVRSLHQYCVSKGVEPKDLSPEELKQFEVPPNQQKKVFA
jgi:hypothetical protein